MRTTQDTTPTLVAGSVDQETCLVVSVSELVEASFDGVGGFAAGGPPSEFCGKDVDLPLQLVFTFDQFCRSGVGPLFPPHHGLMVEMPR